MRKIGFAQHKNEIKEILPKSYKIESMMQKRRMFFVMINEFLDKEAKISTKNNALFKKDILAIMIDKIESFFPLYRLRNEKAQKIVKIYAEESLLFNQFFKMSKIKKFHYLSNKHLFCSDFKIKLGYSHPAAQLISLIFNGKEIEMMMDLDLLFTTIIYKRIKPELDKKITLSMPYIHIEQHGVLTRIYPQWRDLNPKNIMTRSKDINDGLANMAKDGIDQCYLIYPKTNNFQRHIRVKGSKENMEIKLIPYSFTFCNR
ncbi:MAG: hypothetical protein Q7S59_05735 [Sulfurimonas sp.]|nr:hypothetical protein [Sulfurimonas sp.]